MSEGLRKFGRRVANAEGIIAIALVAPLHGAMAKSVDQLEQSAVGDRQSDRKIEEIVVTAMKREQSLQEASVSVQTLSGDRLRDLKVTNVEDMQLYAPSLTISDNFGTVQISSRGLGLNSVSAGIDPAVGLYVDGAVINSPISQAFSFFDLQRLEVSRGPQGTLFGRNTTGGAINLITAKPTKEFEAYAEATAGRFSLIETEGGISGPLTDEVRARIAWRTISRDGFGINEFTGKDVTDANKKMARAHIEFAPTAGFEFLLTGEYADQNDQAFAFKFKEETFPELDPAPGRGGFPTDGPRNINTEFDPQNKKETWSITGTADWRIDDHFSVKSITNYRDIDTNLIQDLDLSSIVNRSDVTGVGGTNQERPIHIEQWSQELQLSYNGPFFGRNLDVISGFFYFNEENETVNTIGFQPLRGRERVLPDGTVTTDKRVQLIGEKETDSWALYWNARWNLIEKFFLKVGGRFTRDDITVVKNNFIFVANGTGPQLNINPFDGSEEFEDYTPEVGLEWTPADNLMLFYTYSEGFKAGTVPIGSTSGQDFVNPETIENNEFGLKSSWLDNSLIINITGFFYTAEELQLQRAVPTGPGSFTLLLSNSADQEGHGIELDTRWTPMPGLRFDGSVSWLKTEFQEGFVSSDPTDPLQISDPTAPELQQDLGGNDAALAPEWSATAHIEYDLPFRLKGGTLTLAADVSYKGDHFFNEFNNPRLSQDNYTIVDAQMRFQSANERWGFRLWGKNLNDKLVESGNFPLGTGRVIARTFLEPLTWGGTVEFRY